ncbi:MAG: peptidylprolyl isomerase [Candidatus Latescibacterota bacterium]|nr:MAG: peptidylprolyl isomerase [Candidatus Latescibacterota bacterium]
MVRRLGLCCFLSVVFILAGCGAKEQTVTQSGELETSEPSQTAVEQVRAGVPDKPEPDRITVQHLLIGFQGSVEDKEVTRSEDEAEQLANELFQRAKSGEDFDALVKEYTDDRYPGIYGIVNDGVEANEVMQIYPREKMAPHFCDIAFKLKVGEIGLAPYDKKKCKFGWHIIKRLR